MNAQAQFEKNGSNIGITRQGVIIHVLHHKASAALSLVLDLHGDSVIAIPSLSER
jgi:hypothetical protein